ncbi:MAG TPA: HDIG domain-containing protein [Gemmataceae bacterium]|nr:HDIG domain-containing protein [Gemmataceae bacterium]
MFKTWKKNPRLQLWNDRHHSAPRSLGILPLLREKLFLARVGLIVGTALTLTLLQSWLSPSVPVRVGETCANDIRVRVGFSLVNGPQTARLREELQEQTGSGEASTTPVTVVEEYPPGTPIVKRGQPISVSELALLREEAQAYARTLSSGDHVRHTFSLLGINLLLTSFVALYISRYQPHLAGKLPSLIGVSIQAIATVFLALLVNRAPWNAAVLPLTLSAMIYTVVFPAPFAMLLAFTLSLTTVLSMGTGTEQLLILMGGLAPAALMPRGINSRSQLVKIAATAGLAFAITTWACYLLTEQTLRFTLSDAIRNFFWALLAGFILGGSIPLIERCYGVVTDVSLMELADSSHPLLQDLIRRAPGTYTHSMTMATLAEAAAKEIGANPLLTRVSCYFHDVGKMVKPQYFVENQNGYNRHDQLEPAMSVLIIVGHVKDGVALAEQHRLPAPVIDAIQQHHGTTLVEYFYREALRLQEQNGRGNAELEFAFRYPGPKPQTKEIAIVMLADAVESASRALTNPTPASLRKLVHDLLMKRLLDGQFEESGLTLTELHRIEESISKSVIALYHARIQYPDECTQEAEA